MNKEYYQKLLLSKGIDKKFLIKRENETSEKKKKLMEMARNGEPKPSFKKHNLGQALSSYTNPNSGCYDEKFTNELKKIRPDWFVSQSESANVKKKQLLEMAKNGESRPKNRKSLVIALSNYINPKHNSYDEEFTRKIKKIRPDWFINTANEKKEQLLEMAKSGESKPICGKHHLGGVLFTYTNPKKSSYDEDFTRKIREIRPDWFVNTADEKKKKLLEMAKNGEPKPKQRKHSLASVLYNYISPKKDTYDDAFTKKLKEIRPDWFVNKVDIKKEKLFKMARGGEQKPNKNDIREALYRYINPKSNTYDEKFTNELKKIRPDWFVSQSESANVKKKQLIDMAKCGEEKPIYKKHPLGNSLSIYIDTKNKCYDKKFTNELKKIRPDWFVTPSDIASDKKKQLLEMAKCGEPKPSYKNNPLANVFCNYTNFKGNNYDEGFTKKIRKIRPDWFVTRSDITSDKKKQLLKMAKCGKQKPIQAKSPLGKFLSYSINPKDSRYDEEFTKELKKIRTDWFITRSDIANKKKEQLLEMAKCGEPKPIYGKHSLGIFLSYNINPKRRGYDGEFTKKLKKIAPHWFKK